MILRFSSVGLLPLVFVLLALGLLGFALLHGTVWAAQTLLPPLRELAWAAGAVALLVLLPLSSLPAVRGYTGTGIVMTSYLLGVVCWFSALLTTYAVWGAVGVLIGLLVLGVGVVPVGVLASIWQGDWPSAGTLVGLALLAAASRRLGLSIGASWRPSNGA